MYTKENMSVQPKTFEGEPWCSNVFFPGETKEEETKTFTDENFHEILDFVKSASCKDSLKVASLIYVFVNKAITQNRKITPDECRLIIDAIWKVLPQFPNMIASFWVTRVILDLYDEDPSIMAYGSTLECIVTIMNQMNGEVLSRIFSNPDNRDEFTSLVNSVEMLLTLIGTLICYGIDDPDIWTTQWPVQLFRPAEHVSLDYLFDSDQFCTGIVNVLIFCTSVFERSHAPTDMFHWDLALLSLVIKNRVITCPGLQMKFHPRIVYQLWKCCSSFEMNPDASLPWKEHVFEMVSVLCTGKFAGLVGIAGFAHDRDQRFHLILRRILRTYGDLESVREVCMDCRKMKLISPWVQESALQLVLSPPDLRPVPSSSIVQNDVPETRQVVVEEPAAAAAAPPPQKKQMTPEEERAFWKEMLEDEERERKNEREEKQRKSSMKKKKKSKHQKMASIQTTNAVAQPPPQPSKEDSDDDNDDDDDEKMDERLTRLVALRKSSIIVESKPIIPILIPDSPVSPPPSSPTRVRKIKPSRLKTVSKETPKEAPKEAPKETQKETPKEDLKEAPKEAPKETPKETPKEAPKETLKEAPRVEEVAAEVVVPLPEVKVEVQEEKEIFERLFEWRSDTNPLPVLTDGFVSMLASARCVPVKDVSSWMPSIYYSLARKSVFSFAKSGAHL